jgi:hypothetical protein
MASNSKTGFSLTDRSLQFLLLVSCLLFLGPRAGAQQPPGPAPNSATPVPPPDMAESTLPRGKKLMLKDGNFQLVREYKLEGDRVRYYSIEQMDWEEMPAALVDWDSTKKIEADEAKRNAAIIAKAHAVDVARNSEMMDIDASIEVAPNVFLPSGEGLFEFDGSAVLPLRQAEADIKFSKTQMLKQVLIPIAIPNRHTVSLKGPRAKFRMQSVQTEFYMRVVDGREPELDLLRAKVHDDKRDLENLDDLFKEHGTTGKVSIPMQRWEVARGVYRFTISQDLEPGEYALGEIIQGGGTSMYFWDFGVDGDAPRATKPK